MSRVALWAWSRSEFALDGGENLSVGSDQVLEQAHEIMMMTMTNVVKRGAEAKSVVLASGVANSTNAGKVDSLSRDIVVEQEGSKASRVTWPVATSHSITSARSS